MHLIPSFFKLKWFDRFATNDDFAISEADLREFAGDVADSAGVSAQQLAVVATKIPSTPPHAQDYALTAADAGQVTTFKANVDVVLTLPEPAGAGIELDMVFHVCNRGTGLVRFAPATANVVLETYAGLTVPPLLTASVRVVDAGTYFLTGGQL